MLFDQHSTLLSLGRYSLTRAGTTTVGRSSCRRRRRRRRRRRLALFGFLYYTDTHPPTAVVTFRDEQLRQSIRVRYIAWKSFHIFCEKVVSSLPFVQMAHSHQPLDSISVQCY